MSIRGEAQATDGRLEAVEGLELPDAARAPISESRASQARIVELSSDVMGANASGREGLSGVRNTFWDQLRRLSLWLLVPLLLVAALILALWLAPTGVARVVPGLVRLVFRSSASAAKLLREQLEDPDEPTPARTREAVAALRSNRHGEAAWRAASR